MSTDVRAFQQEVAWRRYRGSGPNDWEACLAFLTECVVIRHPERGRIPFELRDAQRETLQAWLTERYCLVLKARQIGYSTLASAMALWIVLFHPDKYLIFLSRGEREANALLSKAKYAYKYLPQWILDRAPENAQNTLSVLSFKNESGITSLPSTQDPARGESAYMIIVDEWAFLENPEEAWASIEPVADVGGRIIGLSTANGSGNFFHRHWQMALNGKRWKALFYPWSANTDRDDTWYEDKKEDMAATPWLLHQEYPRNAEEAFIKSGRSVFDVDFLDTLPILEPRKGHLWAQTDTAKYAEFREHKDGELLLYQPPDPTSVYAIGADVAEGLEHGDYSCAHVVDVLANSVCAVWHGHVDPDQFSLVLYRLGYFYNAALIGVEINNHGLTTGVGLQKLRYPKLYYRRQVDQRTNKPSQKLGWRTQQNTKPYAIDQLAKAIRGERGVDDEGNSVWDGGLQVRDAQTISEMKLFVSEPDGKHMHGSPYDDRVMSLAIALEMTKHVHAPMYSRAKDEGWGTLEWWEQQLTPDVKAQPIGAHNVRRGTLSATPR